MRSTRLQLRAPTRPLLILAVLLAAGCGGGGGGGGVTDPPPGDDPPPPNEPPTILPRGSVVYAVDNGNRLLVFGTDNADTVSRLMRIRGLPILSSIVGIAFRPSNGRLYGVGTDSRVYVLDTLTGAATPVASEPFSPAILSAFDIHFGMGFDPASERIRLISTELGVNWSIDPDDGTAIQGASPSFAAGDPHEGVTPHIAGLAFTPPGVANGALSARVARLGDPDLCEGLMWAMDVDLKEILGSCDPDQAEFTSLGPIPELESLACAELDFDSGFGRLWIAGQRANNYLNSIGTVEPETGLIIWHKQVPDNFLIQAITFEPKDDPLLRASPAPATAGPPAPPRPSLTLADPGVDPVALCRGADR